MQNDGETDDGVGKRLGFCVEGKKEAKVRRCQNGQGERDRRRNEGKTNCRHARDQRDLLASEQRCNEEEEGKDERIRTRASTRERDGRGLTPVVEADPG